jgi:uncharacterized protein YecA (UPF0149 family)
MSDAARELVDRLVAAGEWPEPQLLEDILTQGEAAVESLREVIRRDVSGWPDEAAVCFAVDMLGTLGAVAAIPDLIQLFHRYENETVQSASTTLGRLGALAVDPALSVVRDGSLGWYSRSEASTAAILAAGNDPELRARVAATLRELLAKYVAERDELDGQDDYEMASSLVLDLTHLADPEARELIAAAFKANIVEPLMINQEDVDYYYDRGPAEVEQPEPRDWLEEYKDLYEEEMESRKAPREPEPGLRADRGPLLEIPEPIAPYQHSEPRVGRNDPCWCGSGKKYKNCHLQQDREKEQERE